MLNGSAVAFMGRIKSNPPFRGNPFLPSKIPESLSFPTAA
jgi:hypothetical protein